MFKEVLLTRLGLSPADFGEENGFSSNGGSGNFGGSDSWGDWAQQIIGTVIQGTSGGGGVGYSNPVNCPDDPKFQQDHGQEFYQRARQYGVPVIGLWYGNMVQVDPSGGCKRIGFIGGPGGDTTYNMAKQFLVNLGTRMAFWGARQPEGGWLFYAPPNYIGAEPPPGFAPPGPVPSPTASSQLPLPGVSLPGMGPGSTQPYPYGAAQTSMMGFGNLDTSSLLMLGGLALFLFTKKK